MKKKIKIEKNFTPTIVDNNVDNCRQLSTILQPKVFHCKKKLSHLAFEKSHIHILIILKKFKTIIIAYETYKSTQKKFNLLLSCILLHDNNKLF